MPTKVMCGLWTGKRCERVARWSVTCAKGMYAGAPIGSFCTEHVKVYRVPSIRDRYTIKPVLR